MRERPILFSAPMVRAILADTKTQTRRVVKLPPHKVDGGLPFGDAPAWAHAEPGSAVMRCPYGKRGDHLWVRETFQRFTDDGEILYMADPASWAAMNDLKHDEHPEARWRPSIHMPRWASRITLEVTGVRVERLQSISRGDAMSEGCPFPNMAHGVDPRDWFAELWGQINGPGSWGANPFVWVVDFRRIAQESKEPSDG